MRAVLIVAASLATTRTIVRQKMRTLKKVKDHEGRLRIDETTSGCEDKYCKIARLRHTNQQARECHNKAVSDAGN